MRWVFYSLVVVNLVYLGWQLASDAVWGAGTSAVAERVDGEASRGAPALRLLSEAPQPDRALRPDTPARPGLCPVVGPWSARDEAERARVQLEAAGLSARIRAVTVQKDQLNWVYLPSYGTRERALEVLSELQSRGVDSFIVKAGEDANAISLGYFTSEESAKGLSVKMHNAGYPAFVRETSRPVTEYWLYMSEQADGAAALEDFLIGNPAVDRDRVACRPSGEQTP
ncbi:MAG TPA: SPOR domain-containing protein [Alcanivorax sp.]|nr:SPOR domain-containing protein [Alcanivorax sp.]